MSDMSNPKLRELKSLLVRLHRGENAEKLRAEFQEAIRGVSAVEVAQVEEELIREGLPREEIQKLCDVHLAVLRESLEKEPPLAPAGHPIHILMEEHKLLLKFANELIEVTKRLQKASGLDTAGAAMEQLQHIVQHFKDSESHYLREENVLFPYLEKHGITQPPAIMWMEHDKIREIKKGLYARAGAQEAMSFVEFAKRLEESALALAEMLSQHFYKENNILFPTALRVIGEDEWPEIRNQFDELGYCRFTPETARKTFGVPAAQASQAAEGVLSFETGALSPEQIEAIFNSLPVDITFVDHEDTVRYYSASKERIFVRIPAVIGRKVQHCHPEKSLHLVNRILEDFKSGKRDVAEFWINMNGRLIHIRYFAVRGKGGEYLGCTEVTQDITDIQKIEGEKRLL
ncbi:MAG: DUF438 domain-containing protein [Calditrichaeota bacterium]|nr:DUF438 domain-containing protein [Calditrichota bacterium]